MPGANVLEYVARQSAISLIAPHGDSGVDISGLDSQFQRRMVLSDLRGSGAERIVAHSGDADVVLIDLVDERRGHWLFPDSSTMTNSLEVESCGAAEWAANQGAELIEFGTYEHFEVWKRGFGCLIAALREADMWDRTIFLDIEWARVFSGSPYPSSNAIASWGRRWRRAQRGVRNATRRLESGDGVSAAWKRLRTVEPTEAEEFADRAVRANQRYLRYREFARDATAATVTRQSRELRINADHKWGPQPFHYRDSDYRSVVGSIMNTVRSRSRSRSRSRGTATDEETRHG